jgi:hypothetical protein
MTIIDDKKLDIWFSPWEYTHTSWIENTMFTNLNAKEQKLSYVPWCKSIGIEYEFSTYHQEWLDLYWLEQHILFRAINLLGSIIHKQKDNVSNVNELRWIQQTALARPIILNKSLKFTSNFEAGLNLLYQVLQCYSPSVWTRFLLQLPKEHITQAHIYTEPLVTGKMILIIEKLWRLILKKIS